MSILIRSIGKSDYNLVLKLLQNEDVRKFLGGVPSTDYIKKSFKKMIESQNEFYFVVCNNDDKIGVISIDKYHDGINYEISYQFLPEYWGNGFAFASILLVFEYIKIHTPINVIYAETQDKNLRSKSLLKKLGMVEIEKIERYNEQQVIYIFEFV